jgi:hypothetical protein
MKTSEKAFYIKAFAVLTVLIMTSASVASAEAAAKKTITCYKGTVVKKVTAATPKCPKGYTTKKPVVKATPTATSKATGSTVAFSATYTGQIGLLWGDGFVQATSVDGKDKTNALGLTDLSGSGSAAPGNQCDVFNGTGVISGGGNSLKVTFDSASTRACAEDAEAPTKITFTGNAIINSGTGKYAGATGTLKVTAGSFDIQTSTAGKKESDAFKFTISGNINTK